MEREAERRRRGGRRSGEAEEARWSGKAEEARWSGRRASYDGLA